MNLFSRPMYYLLDEQGVPYPTNDSHAASELLGRVETRRVGLIEKEVAGHTIKVSTVFLVFDHNHSMQGPPVLYESMLFVDGQEVGGATQRYETKEQASTGHEEIAEKTEQVLMLLQQQNIDMTQIAGLLTNGED